MEIWFNAGAGVWWRLRYDNQRKNFRWEFAGSS